MKAKGIGFCMTLIEVDKIDVKIQVVSACDISRGSNAAPALREPQCTPNIPKLITSFQINTCVWDQLYMSKTVHRYYSVNS
jgi:hypothetical protein